MEIIFSDVDIPELTEYQAKLYEEDLTKKDLYNFLKSMQYGKSSSKDKLTK